MDRLIISWQEVVTSTSDLVFEALDQHAPEGTAFTADIQTKGRGRHGRTWHSPRGNFYISILLYPKRPLMDWPSLSLMTALALYDAVVHCSHNRDLALKWPNDLLYQGGKSAGILLEKRDDAVVIGCGVNLDAPPDEVQGWAPSSLNQNKNENKITSSKLQSAFDATFTHRYKAWTEAGFAGLKSDWLMASAHHGLRLRIDQGGGKFLEGIFTDLSDDGRLCLCDDNGVDHLLAAGDVIHARLANADKV